MNQILMTEPPSNKKSHNKVKRIKEKREVQSNVQTIVRFFALAIILLGLCFSGSGSYAIYEDIQHKNNKDIPELSSTQMGNSVKLSIKNKVGIKTIKYSINDGIESIVQGKNQKTMEVPIELKAENNRLKVSIIDSKNDETAWVKNYIVGVNEAPAILISSEEPRVKITVTSDKELDYIVYKYGDNQEVRINASATNQYKIEAYVDNIVEIEQLLVVEAVDKQGNSSRQEKRIKGTTKPTIEVTANQTLAGGVDVKIKDNTELQMVVLYLNGEEKLKTNPDKPIKEQVAELSSKGVSVTSDGKEISFTILVNRGTTQIKINAYNVDGQVTEYNNQIIY